MILIYLQYIPYIKLKRALSRAYYPGNFIKNMSSTNECTINTTTESTTGSSMQSKYMASTIDNSKPQMIYITIDEWLSYYESILQNYENNGVVTKRNSFSNRCFGFCCLPICCLPCLLWSVGMRLITCPLSCLLKGIHSSCDGACTETSDMIVGECVKELNSVKTVPILKNAPSISIWDECQKIKYLSLLERVECIFKDIHHYEKKHYQLAEALLNTLPYQVTLKISTIKTKLGLKISNSTETV